MVLHRDSLSETRADEGMSKNACPSAVPSAFQGATLSGGMGCDQQFSSLLYSVQRKTEVGVRHPTVRKKQEEKTMWKTGAPKTKYRGARATANHHQRFGTGGVWGPSPLDECVCARCGTLPPAIHSTPEGVLMAPSSPAALGHWRFAPLCACVVGVRHPLQAATRDSSEEPHWQVVHHF